MEKHSEINGLRTWIEIDTKAVANNYALLRGLIPANVKFMAVVKSNAYGHSLVDFSKEIEKLGADWLGVDSIVEAETLRKNGIVSPILVLGYTLPCKILSASENNVSITVSTFETLDSILDFVKQTDKNLAVHIKVDTGMHRQGFQKYQIDEVISKLKSLPKNVIIEGLFTHFASAKNPVMQEKTSAQIKEFEIWKRAFADAGFTPLAHAAASAGAMIYPQSHFDLVRFGIAMYGVWPSSEVKIAENGIDLKPILSWKTIISEIKSVSKGEGVGYDFSAVLQRDSKLAICPIGYWHGLPRSVSNVGYVLVAGRRAPIIGRVSMDMVTIDVTDIVEVKVGSVVTIIGHDGNEEVRADQIADPEKTSEYEIITRLNPLIKRIFI